MCEIRYDYPYIYLLEFHIGDGYFDRQRIGEYSVLVTYRDGANLLVKERERGDDRLVKFRQGKSVIFGITKPDNELKIIVQAFDNNEEIGKSSLYFLGIGSPNVLAKKSLQLPTASIIRTNLQLSHGAGSLQVFARLTCFGETLLTDFSVSGEVNTEFDAYVNDIELNSEESFTRCNFNIGHVKDSKDIHINKNPDELNNLMKSMKLNDNESTLCFYEASSIIQEESDELLKQTILQKKSEIENMHDLVSNLVEKAVGDEAEQQQAVINKSENEPKPIRTLDDLMFSNFIQNNDQIDASIQTNIGRFLLSADNSVLDLKNYDEIDEGIEEEKNIMKNESNIGDAPPIEEDKSDKDEEKSVKGIDNITEIPCETGDAPKEYERNRTVVTSKKRPNSEDSNNEFDEGLEEDEEESVLRYFDESAESATQAAAHHGDSNTQDESTIRKYAKGKRRVNK